MKTSLHLCSSGRLSVPGAPSTAKHGPGFRRPQSAQSVGTHAPRPDRSSSAERELHTPNPLPEWTIVLTGEVQKAKTLSDMGIFPVQRWKMTGRCSWHGPQSLTVETTELQCQPCNLNDVKRWLPITSSRLLRDGEQ